MQKNAKEKYMQHGTLFEYVAMSGGNQQKVIPERWMADARIDILMN